VVEHVSMMHDDCVDAREGWIEWGGQRTWYRIAGDPGSGPAPLLCLHGGPGSTHHYFAPLERLAAEGRAVVLYDQLGCGRSDRPDGIEWSLQVFLDELAALREQLGLERIHLLGTSWGGMLALEHALSLSGEDGFGGLKSLVLSSTLASAAEWEVEVKRLRDELPADVRAVLDEHEHAGTYDSPEYEAAEAVLNARHFYRRGANPPEIERMLPERGRESYRAMWGPNEWTLTGALRGWDVRPRLVELDLPALVLRGRYDLSTASITATLVRGLPQAREVVFEHSSHTPVLEETDRYLQVVGAFLREHD
jgi:proline-specific peptidase